MDYRWKCGVGIVMGLALNGAFAGPTGERDNAPAPSQSFASPSLSALFNVTNNIDQSGSVLLSRDLGPTSSSTTKPEKPDADGASNPVVIGTLGSGLSTGEQQSITVPEVIGALAENAESKPTSDLFDYSVGNAGSLADLFTPVNSGAFLKGSIPKSSLASAAFKGSNDKKGTAGAEIKNGKTGERDTEKQRKFEGVPGLDPNVVKTTFGSYSSNSGDFLAALTSPNGSTSDDEEDGSSSKSKEPKKDEKETPKEKAEREEQVRTALSDPLTVEKYNTMADQIVSNEAAVKKLVENESERLEKTMELVDKFSTLDENKERAKKAMYFRNYLERQTDNPGLLGDTGTGISVRPPIIHND